MDIPAIEALLSQATGSETIVDDTPDQPFHPQAFLYYNEDPRRAPALSKTPLFEVLLALHEAGDSNRYRIDRQGELLLYACVDHLRNEVTYVYGQGVLCAPGSDIEAVFVMNALAAITDAAAEPLRASMPALKTAGLTLSNGYQDTLQHDLFGA